MSVEGERPASRWEGLDAEVLARSWGVPEVHPFESVGSTNDVARRLAEAGAPASATVVAGEQVAGRGRAGRSWSSPAGFGLWLSMVVRPPALPAPGALPLLAALATAGAVDRFLEGESVAIKWPNDLLLGGRKLGGILCEAAWTGPVPAFVVVGLGLNVLHRVDDFPPAIRAGATSLRMAGARDARLLEVAAAVVHALRHRLGGECSLAPADLRQLEARNALRGREVLITEPSTGAELARGIAAGFTADAALRVRDRSGVVHSIHSGTVRIDD